MSLTAPIINALQISYQQVCLIAVLDSNGHTVDVITDILPGGSITVDTTAETVRSCSFQCLDPTGLLTPNGTKGELNPDGVEVQIYLGYMNGSEASVWPQGIFSIQETDDAIGDGQVPVGPILNVTGYDRSSRIAANTFDDAFNLDANLTVYEAVTAILAAQAPWVTHTNIATSSFELAAQTYQPGDDPWQGIQLCAAAAGQVAFFDVNGVLCIINNPSTSGAAPQIAIVDSKSSIASDITNQITNSPGYNGVTVTASNLAGSAVSGAAYDTNPTSPTYCYGPYGFRSAPPVQSSIALTADQCSAMAATLLPQVLGLTISVLVDMLTVPFLDAFDLVQITNSKAYVAGIYIVEQLTVPMDCTAIETATFVPIGTALNIIDGLGDEVSIAAFSSTSINFSFNGASGTFTGFSSGSTTSDPLRSLFGGGGLLFLGGGGGGPLQLLWPNGLGRRTLRKTVGDPESDLTNVAEDL